MGVDARGFPRGLLRLDPTFVYVEPPSSWPLSRAEYLTPAPNIQWLTCVWLFATLWIAARQDSLSFTISQSLLRLMSTESMMLSNNLILSCPLLLLSSIVPSIRVFSNVLSLCIRWPKYWSSSFSISPPNWFPLGLTGWISLQSKGLSRVSSSTQFKSIKSSAVSLLHGPILTSIHNYWKKHSFDYMDLCQQSFISAF